MKSIFRATAILSGSSFVSILFGLVSAKVLALVLQPTGYGYYGLAQNFVGFASLLTGVGMATGLVRLGAGAATSGDEATVANLRSGTWLLLLGLGGYWPWCCFEGQ
jgi:PST family polysaccharide transporter